MNCPNCGCSPLWCTTWANVNEPLCDCDPEDDDEDDEDATNV